MTSFEQETISYLGRKRPQDEYSHDFNAFDQRADAVRERYPQAASLIDVVIDFVGDDQNSVPVGHDLLDIIVMDSHKLVDVSDSVD